MSASLTLYGFGTLGALCDVSPFVHKLENYLRLAGLAYDKRAGNIRTAPRGKLPYIEHEGRQIPDSQGVIRYLREAGLADLDAGLDAAARADAFALRSMIERDLYFAVTYVRWQRDEGWAAYGPTIRGIIASSGVPSFLLGMIVGAVRKATLKQLFAQGTGRMDEAEIIDHARRIFETLDQFAARRGGPFFFGDAPTSLDAVVHAFVAGIVEPAIPTPLKASVEAQTTLMARYRAIDERLAG
ncbi:MAG: Tom37 metaxin N-terminal-like domain-containing protein [Nannocystaceae bacterium]